MKIVMANYDHTRNVGLNEVGDGYYANSFYGTYDHYQRIGWFFDKVVSTIDDLDDCLDILTGRFVLVEENDAIFMRDYAYDIEGNYFQYYDSGYEYEDGQFIPIGEAIPIKGFKFIGFATRRSKLLFNENGQYGIIEITDDIPYKIAKTKNIQQYTPIIELEAISDIDNRENFDKNKFESDSYIIDDERRVLNNE